MSKTMVLKAITTAMFCGICAFAKDTRNEAKQASSAKEARQALFSRLVGHWQEGTHVRGEIKLVMRGEFLRHTYGTIEKFSKHGEAMIGFNPITKKYQMSWIDPTYMNDAILFSEGEGNEQGFTVIGEYDTGPGQARGRWRTEYKLVDDDHLTVTGYRVSVASSEVKAYELKYERIDNRANK